MRLCVASANQREWTVLLFIQSGVRSIRAWCLKHPSRLSTLAGSHQVWVVVHERIVRAFRRSNVTALLHSEGDWCAGFDLMVGLVLFAREAGTRYVLRLCLCLCFGIQARMIRCFGLEDWHVLGISCAIL